MIDTETYLNYSSKENITDEESADIIEYNKKLVEDYPFLMPYNRFTGEPVGDYEFTELDSMPNGWRLAFGDRMLHEIKEELIKENYLDNYRVTQIKEKWGELRWYDNGCSKELSDILDKYTLLSRYTCIDCGNKADYISKGWVAPLCNTCTHDLMRNKNIPENEILEYFNSISEEDKNKVFSLFD